jgi:5-methylthioadenosine/S-adenosylhomocysteine deaminase
MLAAAVRGMGKSPVEGGVYVNARGPRFETKSEIRWYASCGDVVGMTAAHEASACQEVGLKYGMVCVVDNVANGLEDTSITLEAFKRAQKENQGMVERLIQSVMAAYDASKLPGADSVPPGGSAQTEAAAALHSLEAVDLLVSAAYVIPVEPEAVVHKDWSVAVRDGNIVGVCATSQARSKYAAARTLELPQHIITPGLVNAHTHVAMNSFRGMADDFPLREWLTTKMWPAEAKCVSHEFCRDGTTQAVAEMLRGGTTTFNDMYWFPEATAGVVAETGIRASLGMTLIDFPTSYGSGADDYITKGKATRDAWIAKGCSRLSWTIAPHAPYTVCDENLAKVKAESEALGVPVHVHLHETRAECDDSESGTESMSRHRSEHNCRPVENFHRLGLLSERLIAVHMTDVSDKELRLLCETGSNVVHCPSSNLKLASGFARIGEMVRRGVNVAIGTDGAASNNTLDMVAEMRLAAILAKGVADDATAVPAHTALRMATINGARALGLQHRTGSLEVGKAADMVAWRFDDLERLPLFDPISHLVYASSREMATHVWVDGKCLLEERRLTTMDYDEVRETARRWGKQVREALEGEEEEDA